MFDKDSDTSVFVDEMLKGRPEQEQVKLLRQAVIDILCHGWVDDDLRDKFMEELACLYDIPYTSDEDELEDE